MMADMEPDPAPDQSVADSSPDAGGRLGFTVQSREDTDVGWGDQPESGDDHLYRELPPHWEPA
jgi:hypothetical protein